MKRDEKNDFTLNSLIQGQNQDTISNFALRRIDMNLKVIHTDGTVSIEEAGTIDELIKSGKIIAFKLSGGWVEVRRRSNGENYTGMDRRKTKPEDFFSNF